MAQFDFTRLALDVALRMLLMRMSLPKETQQIDRVIEAFSQRYETCEPGLFGTKGESSSTFPLEDEHELTCRQHVYPRI